MILGIGTDLCAIERIGIRLQERVLAPEELRRLEGLCPERRAERAAGIFAAKEAVAKALGTGFSGFGMKDILILADENGKPEVLLRGKAAQLAGEDTRVHLSISHDGGFAAAFAILERN